MEWISPSTGHHIRYRRLQLKREDTFEEVIDFPDTDDESQTCGSTGFRVCFVESEGGVDEVMELFDSDEEISALP